MTKLVELTESFLTILEGHKVAALNLTVLVALIGVIVHFISPKNQHQKNEALKQVGLFGGALLLFNFVLTVVGSLGQVTHSQESSLAKTLAICLVAYCLLYNWHVQTKAQGKPVSYTKPYRELAEIERWLDDKGQEGFLCESATPDFFSFYLSQTTTPYQYKTAYYPSAKPKERRAFVEKHELDGWVFVGTSHSETYHKDPKKTIGNSMVAIFRTTDMDLPKGSSSRFSYDTLIRKYGTTIILNVLILAFAIGVTWYFSDVKLLLNATVVIGFALCLQIFIYLYHKFGMTTNQEV